MTYKSNTPYKLLFFGYLAIVIICLLCSCNGCKKPQAPVIDPVTIIEQAHNPKIDSLKKLSFILIDSIGKLNNELAKQKQKTALAGAKADQTSNKLRSALNEKDTVEVLVYADDIIEEYNAYIQEANKQDSIQDGIIEKQAATIINDRAEIELHESKYNLLKTAYKVKELEANDWKQEAHKLDKKLKRAKFFNKVLGITTAAGAVLAGVVFL